MVGVVRWAGDEIDTTRRNCAWSKQWPASANGFCWAAWEPWPRSRRRLVIGWNWNLGCCYPWFSRARRWRPAWALEGKGDKKSAGRLGCCWRFT